MPITNAGAARVFAERVPPWHSELNTARFCFGYGAGYDAIHTFLSASERKKIAEAMVRLGIMPTLDDWILPEKRIHALDSMGHNWWSVCVAMAGVSALALVGDDDRAGEWVDEVARGLAQWFGYKGTVLQNKPANFDPEGPFYESVGYVQLWAFRVPAFPSRLFQCLSEKASASLRRAGKGDRVLSAHLLSGFDRFAHCEFRRQRSAPQSSWRLYNCWLKRASRIHPPAGMSRRQIPRKPNAFALLAQKTLPSAAPDKMPLSKMYSENRLGDAAFLMER